MPFISSLYIYPIKSLGGISLDAVELTDRGFKYDRRWMLVDENNQFLTQRKHTQMALLQTAITTNGIEIFKKNNPADKIEIPFTTKNTNTEKVQVWDDACDAVEVDKHSNQWFSEAIGLNCRLMFMPEESHRKIDPRYTINDTAITSFSDAYPVLLIGKESLDDLNSRLADSLPMNRFRPNLVMVGLEPYEEDRMKHFTINRINFYGVKPCSRCVLTTVDQDTGIKGKEPLRTLAKYRAFNNKILFGQNVIYQETGIISKGDKAAIVEYSDKPVFPV